jgi:DNA-binding transcriptional regulator GbsR (MarR family)
MNKNYFMFVQKFTEDNENLILSGIVQDCKDTEDALTKYLLNLNDQDKEFLQVNLSENPDKNKLMVLPEDSEVVKNVIDDLIRIISESGEEESELLTVLKECKEKH